MLSNPPAYMRLGDRLPPLPARTARGWQIPEAQEKLAHFFAHKLFSPGHLALARLNCANRAKYCWRTPHHTSPYDSHGDPSFSIHLAR